MQPPEEQQEHPTAAEQHPPSPPHQHQSRRRDSLPVSFCVPDSSRLRLTQRRRSSLVRQRRIDSTSTSSVDYWTDEDDGNDDEDACSFSSSSVMPSSTLTGSSPQPRPELLGDVQRNSPRIAARFSQPTFCTTAEERSLLGPSTARSAVSESHLLSPNNNNNNTSTRSGSQDDVEVADRFDGSSNHPASRTGSLRRSVLRSLRLMPTSQNVADRLQRTHDRLKKSKLNHLFYVLVLPAFTLLGALLFQKIEGEQDDRRVAEYEARCRDTAAELNRWRRLLAENGTDPMNVLLLALTAKERCFRSNRWTPVTHPMSSFPNAIAYAFSVFTTTGYGRMSTRTHLGRLATIVYGIIGIPLFFALVKDEGNALHRQFVKLYTRISRSRCVRRDGDPEKGPFQRLVDGHAAPSDAATASPVPTRIKEGSPGGGAVAKLNSTSTTEAYHVYDPTALPTRPTLVTDRPPTTPGEAPTTADRSPSSFTRSGAASPSVCFRDAHSSPPLIARSASATSRTMAVAAFVRRSSTLSMTGTASQTRRRLLCEQRKIAAAGVIALVVYVLLLSTLLSVATDFDFFDSFYFTAISIALIGFGDVYPENPQLMLCLMVPIIAGVILFSMCYYIVQEEIRVHAFEASRRAQMSLSRYSAAITQLPWSRRNSPAFDGPSDGRESAFERLRKRRRSAPAISLTGPNGKTEHLSSPRS